MGYGFLGARQEAYKGEIQCPVLPNQICFLTNHNKFHAADLQLLLLSSNQNTVVHRKLNSNVLFILSHFKKIVGWVKMTLQVIFSCMMALRTSGPRWEISAKAGLITPYLWCQQRWMKNAFWTLIAE